MESSDPQSEGKKLKAQLSIYKQQLSDCQTNLGLNKDSLRCLIDSMIKGEPELIKAMNKLVEENVNLQNSLFSLQSGIPKVVSDLMENRADEKTDNKEIAIQTEDEIDNLRMENGYLKDNNQLLKDLSVEKDLEIETLKQRIDHSMKLKQQLSVRRKRQSNASVDVYERKKLEKKLQFMQNEVNRYQELMSDLLENYSLPDALQDEIEQSMVPLPAGMQNSTSFEEESDGLSSTGLRETDRDE